MKNTLNDTHLSPHFLLGEFLNLGKYPDNKPSMQVVANLTSDPARFQRLIAFLRSCEYTDQLLTGSAWLHISWTPFAEPRHYVRISYYK